MPERLSRGTMSETRRIGICQNPHSEQMWWAAKPDESKCVMDCDCTPRFFVAESLLNEALEAVHRHHRIRSDAMRHTPTHPINATDMELYEVERRIRQQLSPEEAAVTRYLQEGAARAAFLGQLLGEIESLIEAADAGEDLVPHIEALRRQLSPEAN